MGQFQIISPLAATNYVKNPAFASWGGTNPDNWTLNTASPALAKSTSVVWTGLQAAKITGYNFLYQNVAVGAAGTQYRVSAYFYVLAGTMRMAVGNSDFSQQINVPVPTSAIGTWYRVEITHTSPANNILTVILQADTSSSVGFVGAVQMEALDTTNQLLNPSFEQWTSATQPLSWVVTGVGANQTTSPIYDGVNSLKISGNGTTVTQTISNLPLGAPVTLTAWVQGSGQLECDMYDGLAATNPVSVGPTLTGAWQQITLTKTVVDGGIFVQFKINNTTDYAYIDAVNLSLTGTVASEIATTYIDGGQPDCVWNGTPYLSTSSRPATTSAGGAIYNLDKFATTVQFIDSVGMPPMENVAIPYAVLDGSQFQRQRAKERPFTLRCVINGLSQSDLFNKRKLLINTFKRDRVPTDQPVTIRYSGGTRPLLIDAVYTGGMEMKRDGTNFVETVDLKFTAYDSPYWRGEGNNAVQILGTATSTVNNCAVRIAGGWNPMATGGTNGANGTIFCSLQDPVTGYIYVGGNFSLLGNLAANGVGYWDGSAWHPLGTGVAGTGYAVNAIARDVSGNIYIAGVFTSAGGVANTVNIAMWNGSAFVALGTGITGANGGGVGPYVYALQPDGVGNIYVGGAWGSAGGVANTTNIAYWSGSAWFALGTGMNAGTSAWIVYGLAYTGKAYTSSGKLVIVGGFGNLNGTSVTNCCTWDGVNVGLLGTTTYPGLTHTLNCVAVGPNGVIYVGFQDTANFGTVQFKCIAQWTGNTWTSMGAGFIAGPGNTSQTVTVITVGPDGTVYAGGQYGSSGGRVLNCLARWSGYDWRPVDFQLSGAVGLQIQTLLLTNLNGGTFFVGGAYTGSTVTISTSAAITHPGTANSNLLFRFQGPGVLRTLTNYTTGSVLHFNDYQVLNGETCILLLGPKKYSFTTNFPRHGNNNSLIGVIAGNSNFTTFKLAPGNNTIGIYMTSVTAGTTSVQAQWTEQYWTIDGSV